MREQLELTKLTAITTLDGRYRDRVVELVPYVSEYNLIRTRIEIEARWLAHLSTTKVIRPLTKEEQQTLKDFSEKIKLQEATHSKDIEEKTRHDVKAMELVFREMVKGSSLEDLTEMIHFGLTSEDINNLAYRLMLSKATTNVMLPALGKLIDQIVNQAEKYQELPMLARTHGQAAVPTTLGKELVVFAWRLAKETKELEDRKLTGKVTGAVGNFNALVAAYPKIDWVQQAARFVRSFGFVPNLVTTQINPYEDMIAFFQNYQRINNIIIDFTQDIWRYISDSWFVQEVKEGERGSSTMPQKVNPIDFENAEGNLGLANALSEHFSRKLPISRMQRDLSDSTVIRNLGAVLGYSLVGYTSALIGLSRVQPNQEKILQDLNADFSILAEGVQMKLRVAGVEDPYSLIADSTRGRQMSHDQWLELIGSLPIDDSLKDELKELTPQNYLGQAVEITKMAIAEIKRRYPKKPK